MSAPALTNRGQVTVLNTNEARGHVRGQVLVALLVPVVLLHVVEVLPAEDDGALHLCGHDGSRKNAATNRHIAGEGALLVHVVALAGGKQERSMACKLTRI